MTAEGVSRARTSTRDTIHRSNVFVISLPKHIQLSVKVRHIVTRPISPQTRSVEAELGQGGCIWCGARGGARGGRRRMRGARTARASIAAAASPAAAQRATLAATPPGARARAAARAAAAARSREPRPGGGHAAMAREVTARPRAYVTALRHARPASPRPSVPSETRYCIFGNR